MGICSDTPTSAISQIGVDESSLATNEETVPLMGLTVLLAVGGQSMRGNKVVVEMKNDTEISGVLEETDRNMK